MDCKDPNSISSYNHQPLLPHLYDSLATHHLNLHQPSPAPPPYSYAASSPYYANPNPKPNLFPSFENSLPFTSNFASTAAAASDALRPPVVDPYPHDPYAYSHLPYDGAGAYSIPSQSYPALTADYYYLHPPPPPPQQQQQHQYGVDSFAYEVVGTGNPAVDLETKKQKVIAGGAPPDSVRVCTVCNVVCNSDKVFALHLAGEKHALKAFGVPPNPLKLKTPTYVKALHSTNKGTHPAKKRTPKTATKLASKRLVTFVHSTYCDVCKIDCQSQEVLTTHKLGRKHKKNLQKLQESITPKPANAPAKVVTANANTRANQSMAVNEQLQKNNGSAAKKDLAKKKKKKSLSGGAAADAARVCSCCNVVCNSELVYNFHIAGKKHAAVVKKQQQQQQAAHVS